MQWKVTLNCGNFSPKYFDKPIDFVTAFSLLDTFLNHETSALKTVYRDICFKR